MVEVDPRNSRNPGSDRAPGPAQPPGGPHVGTTRAPRTRRRSGNGFTLLELLIAITVLATVSMIAWRGLDTLISTRARLAPEGEDVRSLLIVFGQLERDLAGTINPRFFARTTSPVGVTTVAGQPALAITRIAPLPTDGATALQVVGYRVDEGVLVRSASRPMRGRGALAAEEITNVRILEGVKSLRVRLWREGLGWIDPLAPGTATPVTSAAPPVGQPGAVFVPTGVEVTLERNDGKLYRRVLLVG